MSKSLTRWCREQFCYAFPAISGFPKVHHTFQLFALWVIPKLPSKNPSNHHWAVATNHSSLIASTHVKGDKKMVYVQRLLSAKSRMQDDFPGCIPPWYQGLKTSIPLGNIEIFNGSFRPWEGRGCSLKH